MLYDVVEQFSASYIFHNHEYIGWCWNDLKNNDIAIQKTSKPKVQWCQIENQQGPVYDMKWGHFDRVKSTFKMLLSS